MNNGENHRKGPSGDGEPVAWAEAAEHRGPLPLPQETLRRIRLAALALAAGVALSGWNCGDVRHRPLAQETPTVQSDVASEAAESADSKPPDLGKELKQLIFDRFGYPGLIGLALVGFALWVIWKWPEIRKRPFVSKIIDRSPPAPLERAAPTRFTVALAHLEKDPQQEQEKLTFEGLNEGLAGKDENAVQILRFDRTIEIGDPPDLEPVVARGHETARSYLAESGADVLIWGTVVRGGEESAPKLYWTTAREGGRPKDPGRYATEDLALPGVFWTDLVDILRLLVVTRDAEFRSLEGHFVANRLGPFVEKVRSLLTGGGPGWTDDTLSRVQLVLADSLSTLGNQAGLNEPLEEAIDRYREVLTHYTRGKVPLDWAGTQNNLGNALGSLGERESGTERLEEAVSVYRAALRERTRQKVPLDWAQTQNNLGNALLRLGERESGTRRLEEAVEAYRQALQELTREKVPLDWATTQNNLCLALRLLGERESGTKRLEEAVEAYREALQERTREKVPLSWAGTQNNLGDALRSLGERSRDAELVCDALGTHLAGWEVFTQGKAGHYAAMAKRGVEADLAVLKNVADAAEYERCFEEHRAGLEAVLGAKE